jgi:hypothetical protein
LTRIGRRRRSRSCLRLRRSLADRRDGLERRAATVALLVAAVAIGVAISGMATGYF